ncbi:FAM72 protein-domain-containing protein [Chytridium lagenaria]|nr:FAM72 protein-domain-containing protein [Chytridium lagenaria]
MRTLRLRPATTSTSGSASQTQSVADGNLRRRLALSRAAQMTMRDIANASRIPQARTYAGIPQFEYSWNQWRTQVTASAVANAELAHAAATATTNAAPSNSVSVHPSFRTKTVCRLQCKFCIQPICKRGMKAILLADTRVELYSTDEVPAGRVQLVAEDYLTRNCHCRIRDVACLGCEKVIGYHVTQPCDVCMSACNNGHFWMFHDDSVTASERTDGSKVLLWSQLPYYDKEKKASKNVEKVCR